jgi:putative endonuclease
MLFFVYILQCCDGSFYTGCTNNLKERMRQHENGKGAKYTKAHRPKQIAYTESHNSRGQAMKREREIKKLSHQKKLELIKSQKEY